MSPNTHSMHVFSLLVRSDIVCLIRCWFYGFIHDVCPSESFLCLKFPEPGISIQRPSGYTLLMGIGHLSLLYKSAKNNLGLSLVGIRVFPVKSFSPNAKPILGANVGIGSCLVVSCVFLKSSFLHLFINFLKNRNKRHLWIRLYKYILILFNAKRGINRDWPVAHIILQQWSLQIWKISVYRGVCADWTKKYGC